jgi:hypothetical protein
MRALGIFLAVTTLATSIPAMADDSRICGIATPYTSEDRVIEKARKQNCEKGDVLFIYKFDASDTRNLSTEIPAFLCDFGRPILIERDGKSLTCIYRGSPRAERK